MLPYPTDTIVALATPLGTSAIAVVRASGPGCHHIAITVLQRPKEDITPRKVRYGHYHTKDGALLDDVVLTYYRGPSSYTGEDCLEVACHGNPLLTQLIIEDFLVRGCRIADPGEFTRRAFLNGRLDLTQAEAVVDMINASSLRALSAAHQQLRGALGRHLSQLAEATLRALARIEAYIDFPDEDLPTEDRAIVGAELANVLRGTQRLLATQHYGDLLRTGVKTVILGEPNAGKSSLLNRLVGHQRALVSSEPGTTRDYIEEKIMIGDHAIRLIDTAGLNNTPGTVERLGIEQTLARVEEADLVLWVVDASNPLPEPPPGIQRSLSGPDTLLILNKADLLLTADDAPTPPYPTLRSVVVSAVTGQGIPDLCEAISIYADGLQLTLGSETIAINARHADALRRAIDSLQDAQIKLNGTTSPELVSSDLRATLAALGEIGGRIDNERMLDHLFATFCIGK